MIIYSGSLTLISFSTRFFITSISEKRPTVSIVIPTYNHAHFLMKSLGSVMDQTFSDWEAIVVNNFSTDNTIDVVSSFKDERIKLVNFANGGVIAAARNKGIEHSRGEFIAFLDSDDSWTPDKLEVCLNVLSETKSDVISHYLVINNKGTVGGLMKTAKGYHHDFKTLLFNGNSIANSSSVARRSSIESVGRVSENPAFITAEDYELWLKLSWAGCKFAIAEKALGEYLIHTTNYSALITKHLVAKLNVVNFHFAKLKEGTSGLERLLLNLRNSFCLAVVYYHAGRQATAQKKFKESLELFGKSLRCNPFRLKTYAALLITPTALSSKS